MQCALVVDSVVRAKTLLEKLCPPSADGFLLRRTGSSFGEQASFGGQVPVYGESGCSFTLLCAETSPEKLHSAGEIFILLKFPFWVIVCVNFISEL